MTRIKSLGLEGEGKEGFNRRGTKGVQQCSVAACILATALLTYSWPVWPKLRQTTPTYNDRYEEPQQK